MGALAADSAFNIYSRVNANLKQMKLLRVYMSDVTSCLPVSFRTIVSALATMAVVACAQSNSTDSHLVPSPFRGEWNADISACRTGLSDSALRIGADSIWFYESHGPLTDITRRGDSEFTATAHLSGEGEVWSAPLHFGLSSDGNTLTDLRPELGGFARRRCP
jgi:hypothetical protein